MSLTETSYGRSSARFRREFFLRDPLEVARDLLGALLVCGEVAGRIVETEAYAGAMDPASHAYRGKTPRNTTMFGPAGRLYVYFTYGMHNCANVVCGPKDSASAVLLRALMPVSGIETMRLRRGVDSPDSALCAGPARLCEALGIDRRLDGTDLLATRSPVQLLPHSAEPFTLVSRGPRIGLSHRTGEAAAWPWRFGVTGHPALSRRFATV